MRATTIYLFLISALFCQLDGYSQDCTKCDGKKLLKLEKSFDSLNYNIVRDFVCTFDTICKNNVEFGEWSNELLFKLIEKDVNLLNGVLHDLGFNYVKLISKELETPVTEVDLLKIYNIVKLSLGPKDMIYEEKKALKKAAENKGLKINE